MRFEGFQDAFENATVSRDTLFLTRLAPLSLSLSPLQSQFYTVLEAQLLGWVVDGYFVRTLTAISVEGETGLKVNKTTSQQVPVNTSEALIAGFSSRGFASFSVDSSSQVSRLLP